MSCDNKTNETIGAIDKYLGSSFDIIRQIYQELPRLKLIAENIELNKGEKGDTPTVTDNGDGTYTITGGNGSITLRDGTPGTDGKSPTVSLDADGNVVITDAEGNTAVIQQGYVPVKGVDYNDGLPGNIRFKEFQYSVDGVTQWHDVKTTADYYERSRTVELDFEGNTITNGDWSDPVLIRVDGYTPIYGTDYKDGVHGQYTSFVFRNSPTKPGVPVGGEYDGENEVIPDDWTDDPSAPVKGEYVWISKAVYKYNDITNTWVKGAWSDPTKFSGDEGYTPQKYTDYFDGENGNYISFVFKNSTDEPPKPAGGTFDGVNETMPPGGWTDDPAAPETGEYIWVSKNTYKHDRDTNTWVLNGEWSRPVRLSGLDGKTPVKGLDYTDTVGNFVSFVFHNSATKPAKPVGGSYDGVNETMPAGGWTDDPVSPNKGEYIWASKGTYHYDGTTWITPTWGEPFRFSGLDGYDPQPGIDYKDGLAGMYTSFIFTLSETQPGLPGTGSYDGVNEVIPTGWTDDPVTPTPGSKEVIWMSVGRYKELDGGSWSFLGWTTPARMSGDQPYSLILTSDINVFNINKDGVPEPANQKANLSAKLINLTETVTWSTVPVGVPLTTSGDFNENAVLDVSDVSTDTITISAESDGIIDTVTLIKVYENSSAVVGYLTNESHNLPADSSGNVDATALAEAKGNFIVYYGSTDVTADCTFNVKPGTELNVVAPTITSDGSYYINGITDHFGGVVFEATYVSPLGKTFTIEKTFTVTRTNDGYTPQYGVDYSDGKDVKLQFSLDGVSNWSDTYTAGDKYFRTSTDGGVTWGDPLLFKGEDGQKGEHTEFWFLRSNTEPPVPTGNDISNQGWVDTPGLTTGTEQLWLAVGNFDSDDNLIGSWSVVIFGSDGRDGVDGTIWHYLDSGVPGAELGKIGDYALVGGNLVYQKIDATTWTYIKDLKGADGLNAQSIRIEATGQVFKLSADESVAIPDDITLILHTQNITLGSEVWYINGVAQATPLSNVLTITPDQIAVDGSITVTATVGALSDSVTLIKVKDGKTPVKGVDYTDGLSGTYISTVYAEGASAPEAPIDGTYDGVTEVLPKTASNSTPGAVWKDDAFKPSSGNFLWVSKKRYTASIAVDGTSVYDNTGTWTTPVKHTYIPTKGVDYYDGEGVFISYVFKNIAINGTIELPTGGSYDGATETLPSGWKDNPETPASNEVTYVSKRTYTKDNGGNWAGSAWSTPSKFVFEANMSGYLTNESHTVSADSDGNVVTFVGSDGYFKVFLGLDDVSSECTYTYSVVSGNISVGIGLTDGHYSVSSLTSDNAVVEFTATHTTGKTITKRYTISKSKAGVKGADATITVNDNGDGTYTITDSTGGTVTVSDGEDAVPPVVTDNGDGTYSITVNGNTVTWADGDTPQLGIDFFYTGRFYSSVYKAFATPPTEADYPQNGSFDGANETPPDTGWSDSPVYEEGKVTYISKTVYSQHPNTGVWSNNGWSIPKPYIVKGDKGEDGNAGQSVYTAYIFGRFATTPTGGQLPTGGSFGTPMPDQGDWSDGIPNGSLPVYMSKRIFTSDGQSPQEAAWSTPSLLVQESETSRFVFSIDGVSGWTTSPTAAHIYMKLQTRENSGAAWVDAGDPILIKGETGQPGQPGNDGERGSIAFGLATTQTSWNTTVESEIDSYYSTKGLTKVLLDEVTVYNNGISPAFVATRYWDTATSSWIAANKVVDGNLVVNGDALIQNLSAGAISADKLTVTSLSSLSANLGTITSGDITGTTIRTATTGQRVELTSSTNSLTIFNSSNAPIFGVEQVSGNTELFFRGKIKNDTITDAKFFTKEGIDDLRDRLGILISSASTGGTISYGSASTLTGDFQITGDSIYSGGKTITLSLQGSGTNSYYRSTPGTTNTPSVTVQFYKRTSTDNTNWSAWSAEGAAITVTGTWEQIDLSGEPDGSTPGDYFIHEQIFINQTKQVGTITETYYQFRVVITRTAGNPSLFTTYGNLDSFIADEPVSSTVQAHNHAWSDITGAPAFYHAGNNNIGTGATNYAAGNHTHAWSAITGKPTTFTPSSHGHNISDVSGLQTALNGKLPIRSGIVQSTGAVDTTALFGCMITTATTAVGFAYNILLNAKEKGYTVTQSGSAPISDPYALFDGRMSPEYSSSTQGLNEADPYVLTISGLPATHTQTGGYIGWTARYWYPSKFKVEVYDSYQNRGWKTLINEVSGVPTKDLVIPIYSTGNSGSFTDIRITIYDSTGDNASDGRKRWGLSEVFFIHPEASRAYENASVLEATKLSTGRSISLSGDVTGSVTFDGTSNVTISTTVQDGSHNHDWSQITGKPSLYEVGNSLVFTNDQRGIEWSLNTDMASIKFYNTGDGDTNSRLEFLIGDNGNEYFRWVGYMSGGTTTELMTLRPNDATNGLKFRGNKVWHEGNDGSGSGLDADKLDGLDKSYYVHGDYANGVSAIVSTSAVETDTHFSRAGFWDSINNEDMPSNSGWYWGVTLGHREMSSTYSYGGQIAISNNIYDPRIYYRAFGDSNGFTVGSWYELAHKPYLEQNFVHQDSWFQGLNTDLNALTRSGFYRLGPSVTNKPDGKYVDHGQAIVSEGADTVAQIVLPYNSRNMYFRQGNPPEAGGTGVWQPWSTVATLENDQNWTGLNTFDSGINKYENDVFQVMRPKGASAYFSGSTTGCIKITLPVSWSNHMMSMQIRVFNYSTNTSAVIQLSGYNYTGSGGYWYNTSASVVTGYLTNMNSVRFGHDGSKCCIYLGEIDSTWSYAHVTVEEFVAGNKANATTWAQGWSITLESGFASNIDKTYLYNVDGTGVVSSDVKAKAGSKSSPSISFASDTNTGLFSAGDGTIGFTSNGTETMRVTTGTYGLNMYSSINMNSKQLNYASQVHFTNGYYLTADSRYLYARGLSTGAGGICIRNSAGTTMGYLYHDGYTNSGVLNKDGQWALLASPTYTALYYDGAPKLTTTSGGVNITGGLTASSFVEGAALGVDNTSETTRYGIALYGGGGLGKPTYGLLFTGTSGMGTHGSVTGSWATYFTMNDDTTRGWIFQRGSTNVASISGGGNAVFSGTSTASEQIATSDVRIKHDIKPITDALSKVRQISGNTFTRDDVPGRRTAGVIAQEVQSVLPEGIFTTEDEVLGEKLHVSTSALIGLLVEAVKELSNKVAVLEDKLDG